MDQRSMKSKLHVPDPPQFFGKKHFKLEPHIDPGRSSGEPERLQNIVINFHPEPYRDTPEVMQKVNQFWKFIRSNPKLKALKSMPLQKDEEFQDIYQKMRSKRVGLVYNVNFKSDGPSDSDATSKDFKNEIRDSDHEGTSITVTKSRSRDFVSQNAPSPCKLSKRTFTKPDKTVKKDMKVKLSERRFLNANKSLNKNEFPALHTIIDRNEKGQLTSVFDGKQNESP